ncbi:MAG TPA: hypothetical protein VFE67_06515 [Rudaea sp.]|nr:hypothetical protein [Rudaea sp.]
MAFKSKCRGLRSRLHAAPSLPFDAAASSNALQRTAQFDFEGAQISADRFELDPAAAFYPMRFCRGIDQEVLDCHKQVRANAAARRVGVRVVGALEKSCKERLGQVFRNIAAVAATADIGEHGRPVRAAARLEGRTILIPGSLRTENNTPARRVETAHPERAPHPVSEPAYSSYA